MNQHKNARHGHGWVLPVLRHWDFWPNASKDKDDLVGSPAGCKSGSKWWSESPERPLHAICTLERACKALIVSVQVFWRAMVSPTVVQSCSLCGLPHRFPLSSWGCGLVPWWLHFFALQLFYLLNEQVMSASPSLSETMECTWVQRAGLRAPDRRSVSGEPSRSCPRGDRQDTSDSARRCVRGWIPPVFVFWDDWQWYLGCKLWLNLASDTAKQCLCTEVKAKTTFPETL